MADVDAVEEESSDSDSGGNSSDELTSSDAEDDTDRSFGEQFAALLAEPVPAGKCPILCLSKVPQRIGKMREEHNRRDREAAAVAQAKRQLLNTCHRAIADFDPEREARIRKQATRGVIALFNSNLKVRATPAIAEPVPESEVPQKKEEFLNLITRAALKSGK
jgi:protein required for attachment to host cells